MYPRCCTASRIRWRVVSDTPSWPLSTRETLILETCASSATSALVTRTFSMADSVFVLQNRDHVDISYGVYRFVTQGAEYPFRHSHFFSFSRLTQSGRLK